MYQIKLIDEVPGIAPTIYGEAGSIEAAIAKIKADYEPHGWELICHEIEDGAASVFIAKPKTLMSAIFEIAPV